MICTAHRGINKEFIGAYWGESQDDAVLAFVSEQGYDSVEEYEENGEGAWVIPAFVDFSVDSLVVEVDGDTTIQISARKRGELVGSAWVRVKEDTPSLLYDVYVRPQCRDEKIGTAMVLEAMYWAKSVDRGLQLFVSKGNRAAQRLYERLGWLRAKETEENIWYGCPSEPPLPQDVASEAVRNLLNSK